MNTEFLSTSKELDLYDFAKELPDMLPDDGIFVCDSGFADVILPTNAPFKNEQRCIRPISQGAMGYAVPASIGLSITSKKQVLVVVGDGSISLFHCKTFREGVMRTETSFAFQHTDYFWF